MPVLLDRPVAHYERLRTVSPKPEEFHILNTAEWTAAGNTQKSSANGITVLTTAATDNVIGILKRAYNHLVFRDDKPINMVAFVKFTEATVSGVTNFFCGFTDKAGTTTTMLADDGGGLVSSWTGAGFYAVDGSATLRCRSSVGTSYVETILSATDRNNLLKEAVLLSNASQRHFEIDVRQVGPNDFHVNFLMGLVGESPVLVAQHRLNSTGVTAQMGELVMHKNGSANAQVTEVDMIDTNSVR